MKRTIWRAIAAVLFLGIFLAAMPAALAAERTATVHNPSPRDRLNLRKEPRSGAISFGKYYNGVVVEQLADEKDGWMKVRVGNLEGYMQAKYLESGTGAQAVTPAMPSVTIQNGGGTGLTLRERQSVSSKSLGLYKNGKTVWVLGISQTWAHVLTDDGKMGFMLLEHLSPRLEYQYSTASGGASSSSGGASSSGGGGGTFDGPSGNRPIAQWPAVTSDQIAIVSNPNPKDRLHLRGTPSEKGKSLGKYYNGVQVTLSGEMKDGYVKVTIGGLSGYMKQEFLVIGTAQPQPASATPYMTVNNPNAAGNLHLRQAQSTSAKSLGLYKNGTEVVLLGFTSQWAHVMVEGQTGFMLARYLK